MVSYESYAAFIYGGYYSKLTREEIWEAAQRINKDYPELLDAAYKILFD